MSVKKSEHSDLQMYTYCEVHLDGMYKPLWYISPIEVQVGENVLVPYGYLDEICSGVIVSVTKCLGIDAPYPVGRTKSILKKCTLDVSIGYDRCAYEYGTEKADAYDDIFCLDAEDGNYANTVIKGLGHQMAELVAFVQKEMGYRCAADFESEIRETLQPDVYEVTIQASENRFSDSVIRKIIKQFPELKIVAFFEDWKGRYIEGWVCYFAPGYTFPTEECEMVGLMDGDSEIRFTYDCSPASDFEEETVFGSVGMRETVTYRFPYAEQWERFDYVIKTSDGCMKIKGVKAPR